jgi:putative polyhydroxyalkanoate system protein
MRAEPDLTSLAGFSRDRRDFVDAALARFAILFRGYSRGPPMPSISIAKKHRLSHKKAKEVAEKVARDLQARFALGYAWNGDQIDFARPGVSGCMRVGKDRIELDVSLGFLLTPLKPAIEKEIHAQLDRLLIDKSAKT